VRDRIMAYNYSVQAVESLLSGQTNRVMTYTDGTYGSEPISIIDNKCKIDPNIVQLAAQLAV